MQIFEAIFVGVDWIQDKAKTKGAFPVYRKRKKIRVRVCPCGAVSTHIFYPKFSVSFSRIVKTGVVCLYSVEYQCFILFVAWNLVFVPFLPVFLFFLFLLFFLFYFPVYCISASVGWQFAIVACTLPKGIKHNKTQYCSSHFFELFCIQYEIQKGY